jgi:hypothetical protein
MPSTSGGHSCRDDGNPVGVALVEVLAGGGDGEAAAPNPEPSEDIGIAT